VPSTMPFLPTPALEVPSFPRPPSMLDPRKELLGRKPVTRCPRRGKSPASDAGDRGRLALAVPTVNLRVMRYGCKSVSRTRE
jgi:hypothetical protein